MKHAILSVLLILCASEAYARSYGYRALSNRPYVVRSQPASTNWLLPVAFGSAMVASAHAVTSTVITPTTK